MYLKTSSNSDMGAARSSTDLALSSQQIAALVILEISTKTPSFSISNLEKCYIEVS